MRAAASALLYAAGYSHRHNNPHKEAASMESTLVQIGNSAFVIRSDDEYLRQMQGTFEPDTVRLLTALVEPTHVVLDVGANIGCTTLLFGTIASHVTAFEPSPSTFNYLVANVKASGLTNINLSNIGLGNAATVQTLTYAPSNRAGAFVSDQIQVSEGHITERIEIRRLDDVIGTTSTRLPDFVKIDVEGFELSVLEGADRFMGEAQPTVVLEMNHWCLNAFRRTSIPDFMDTVRKRFPIALAVQGDCYLDLHNAKESYIVMYRHILEFQYMNLVCAYRPDQVRRFLSLFNHRT